MADRYDEEMFLGYVEGDLPQEQREQFEALMEEDPRLRNLVAQIIHDRNALRAMPQLEAPANLRERPVEQLERGMLLGPVEPKRVSVGQHRGRMFLPRLLTYGGLAAMLVLCVGLVISMLMEQNLIDMTTPNAPKPSPAIGDQVVAKDAEDNKKPTFVPQEHAHPSETAKPGTGTGPQVAIGPVTTNTMSTDAVAIAPVTTNTTDTTLAMKSNPDTQEPKVYLPPMRPIAIDERQPTIAIPQSNNVADIFAKDRIGNEQYIARLESLPIRMDVATTDIVKTIAGLHSWADRSQALILRPSVDLLTRTGIVIETDGQEEEVELVTDKQIAARVGAVTSHTPPVVRHGEAYVMILAMREDRVPQLVAYLRTRTSEELTSFTQAPNTYHKPTMDLAPAPANEATSIDPAPAPDKAAGEPMQLEEMVADLLNEAQPPAPVDTAPAGANVAVDVDDAPNPPAPADKGAMPVPSNERKLMAIRIIAVAPKANAGMPNADAKLPIPQALPFKVPVIDDPDDDAVEDDADDLSESIDEDVDDSVESVN